eukprot:CAMPEP_0119563022 /NCGR_PEP_ID=MMETSP1352-20130426/22243_1 /TAXON_ID=265584 /ORGANISM="Stauroneis constricta, Strain CCMP1120" /LENGTH=131 /DNA_ID=CAMNT_0007611545 /DNA_START=25 /DNA_END=420 /DNA_ORIENTATION=-
MAALQLYRTIRKSHRKFLPPKLRKLGDVYVRSEFKQHKSVTEEKQLTQFMAAWQEYLAQIQSTGRKEQIIQSGTLDDPFPSNLLHDDKNPLAEQEERAKRISFGKDLPSSLDLSAEQLEQLEKLKKEATDK